MRNWVPCLVRSKESAGRIMVLLAGRLCGNHGHDTAPFRYPHYHEPTDTLDKLDFERFGKLSTDWLKRSPTLLAVNPKQRIAIAITFQEFR